MNRANYLHERAANLIYWRDRSVFGTPAYDPPRATRPGRRLESPYPDRSTQRVTLYPYRKSLRVNRDLGDF